MVLPTITTTVEVTDDHRTAAIENADISHTDNDRNRSHTNKQISALVGVLGEMLAEEAIEKTDDFDLEESPDPKYDGILNGNKIEIKTRKTWNYSKPDLLVRKKFDLASDFYIQIDLYTKNNEDIEMDLSNVTHGKIVGFVDDEDVEKYGEPFLPGKKNDTDKVPRHRLRPMHELHALIC